jgi:hypothetical protein
MEPGRTPRGLSPVRTWAAVGIALIALAVTGCSSSVQEPRPDTAPSVDARSTQSASSDGTTVGYVSGRLLFVGGPAPGRPRATSGTVRLHGSSPTQGSTDRRGYFEVDAVPGTYRVTGRSPDYGDGRYECRAEHAVVVTAAMTSHVNVYCHLP